MTYLFTVLWLRPDDVKALELMTKIVQRLKAIGMDQVKETVNFCFIHFKSTFPEKPDTMRQVLKKENSLYFCTQIEISKCKSVM